MHLVHHICFDDLFFLTYDYKTLLPLSLHSDFWVPSDSFAFYALLLLLLFF